MDLIYHIGLILLCMMNIELMDGAHMPILLNNTSYVKVHMFEGHADNQILYLHFHHSNVAESSLFHDASAVLYRCACRVTAVMWMLMSEVTCTVSPWSPAEESFDFPILCYACSNLPV